MKLVDLNLEGEVLAVFTGLEKITIDTNVVTGLVHEIYEDENDGPSGSKLNAAKQTYIYEDSNE